VSRTLLGAFLAILSAGAIAACGGDDSLGNPESQLTVEEATAPIPGAPAPLQELRADANALLGGGPDAFERRLESLRGFPVVINAWASWCGPCRHEFPFFQSQALEHADEIAFLGVDVADSAAAAETFLSELPLPYPSYEDPGSGVADAPIAKLLDVGPGIPNTIFLDRSGEVAYHWRGSYADEDDLESHIDEYAR
jgi:cytochrome c biogenesis protein CcmG, thiol:disulfide interchange protein DsbE